MRHIGSGARIIHIRNGESENCFCIAVPTPPPDDTGMPHILEHMTLAGSRKFPCKEPFFEMIKRSVATFINALTGNDITYYPVCSTVKADIFNLADVYFDAVFHPELSESTFAREACHLAPANPADPTGALRYDGIVYSEMKGVFSSPDGILERDSIRKLLPDTCHGRESGGNPEDIPSLTLDTLRDFHASRYSPSNAFIILFGNVPTEEWLSFLEPRLEQFKPVPPLPPPARQPRWTSPRSLSTSYPLPPGENPAGKTYLAMNWYVGDSTDLVASARLAILSYLLCGNDASPLSKAIDDSKAGANIVLACPLSSGLEQTWHLAIDGSEPENMELLRKTVFSTLERLSASPFPQEDVEAAFQQTVYACNEITSQFAFTCAMSAATALCAGLDPAVLLEKAPNFEKARLEIEADPMLLPRMVREIFLDNPHRLDITMAPSQTLSAEQERILSDRLADIRASMTDAEAMALAQKAEALEKANARPNSQQDLECLPRLLKSDMPQKPHIPASETLKLPHGTDLVVSTETATNGIVYLAISFDLRGLPARLLPFVQAYVDAVEDFGTQGLDYVAAARKRARCTGSLYAKFLTRIARDGAATTLPAIDFFVKTTTSAIDDALAVTKEAIFGLDPFDRSRMDDILIQQRANLRSYFVQEARATTARHAVRKLNQSGALEHEISGLPLLALVERLCSTDKDQAFSESSSRIAEIRDWLLDSHRITASLTAPPCVRDKVATAIDSWTAEMNARGQMAAPSHSMPFSPDIMPRNEGLSAALQVSFSALCTPAPRIFESGSIPLMAGASLVSSDYMLPEIRFKGNAYGAGLKYDALAGSLLFSSYRDPHIAETRATMLGAADFVKRTQWDQESVDNAILTLLKAFVAPERPVKVCSAILGSHICGETPEIIEKLYRDILALRAGEVRDATVAALEYGLDHAAYCVAASEQALSDASREIPGLSISPIIA